MSSPKEIIFEEEAREKLLKGITQLKDAVCFTLGPKGRNVGLEKSWGAPTITNDGNSIVKEIQLKDQYENMGVSMAKEVAAKIKEKTGDGTTTGTLLLHALCQEGVKSISSGANPILLKRGMDKALEVTVAKLKEQAIPVKGHEQTENIASVSASGNQEIGKLIAEALKKVGKTGVVTIEEGKGTTTQIEMLEGMQFDRGYLSPYFCTNSEKMHVALQKPCILVTDKKINSVQEILPILQGIASTGKELLIIAEDIEGDALATLVVNKIRGILKVSAVKAPGFGDRRKAMLQDIAVLTGATLVSEETGLHLKEATPAVLGSCESVTITKDDTILVGGIGQPKEIQARIRQIENEMDLTDSSYDKEKLQERKAKLAGGVAVIRVGAATEPEMKQKKQLFEDSLHSTQAALEGGITPGGGVALLKARSAISSLNLVDDEKLGAQIVFKACESPLKQLAVNTGLDGTIILQEVLGAKENFGFNVLTQKVENLLEKGIIDPVTVTISALTHAVSVAGIVLLSEALIGNAPEEEESK